MRLICLIPFDLVFCVSLSQLAFAETGSDPMSWIATATRLWTWLRTKTSLEVVSAELIQAFWLVHEPQRRFVVAARKKVACLGLRTLFSNGFWLSDSTENVAGYSVLTIARMTFSRESPQL